MKVSWDDDIPNIWKNKSHVPNHQPENWILPTKGGLIWISQDPQDHRNGSMNIKLQFILVPSRVPRFQLSKKAHAYIITARPLVLPGDLQGRSRHVDDDDDDD